MALALAGAGLLAAIPAIGQEAPESLLPEGFGDPVTAPPPPPPSQRPADTARPSEPLTVPVSPLVEAEEGEEDDEEALIGFAMPSAPVRPLGSVGPLHDVDGGLGQGAFGAADGAALSQMMRRLDAPLPSRWASILLRRTLLSNVPAPSGVSAPDWIAERAWLLLRMGEADSARLLVQSADVSQYSPKLFQVAMQTSLALGDPAGLCPLVEPASATSRETGWILARAMCAALSGEPGTASAAIEDARRTRLGGRRSIDLLLAEKVVGAGVDGRRSVTIEWDGVEQLTTWRYGLATATNVEIPARLFQTAGRQVAGWRARASMLPDGDRIATGRRAAVLGVLSGAALVDLYGAVLDRMDPADSAGTPPLALREAYAGEDVDARLAALRDIWGDSDDGVERYANLILTARAAARVPVDPDYVADTPSLIGAMFTAGFDRGASRWSSAVEDAEEGDAWALLAVGSPRPGVTVSAARAESYATSVDSLKGQFLVAGLAGLGRLSGEEASALAGELEFDLARGSKWSTLLERAVEARQPGTVVLLAALGMQTVDWRYVPPAHLYRIVSALRRVGLEPEARMIAAEALTRV
ncbi:hypothetical protein D3876_01180 [Sphingomonas cavernae]|uniref:Antifreeze protein n=1 Tax=Sphingomonas cavernae TaxID=2320861 RepID=A0A418WSB8_9SPHN|nr:hypothetical protein D3876_01180 [Sphingomonas cavernae]